MGGIPDAGSLVALVTEMIITLDITSHNCTVYCFQFIEQFCTIFTHLMALDLREFGSTFILILYIKQRSYSGPTEYDGWPSPPTSLLTHTRSTCSRSVSLNNQLECLNHMGKSVSSPAEIHSQVYFTPCMNS